MSRVGVSHWSVAHQLSLPGGLWGTSHPLTEGHALAGPTQGPRRAHTISGPVKSWLREAVVRLSRTGGWMVKILEKFWSRILEL